MLMNITKQKCDSMVNTNSYVEARLVHFHIPPFFQWTLNSTTGSTIYTMFCCCLFNSQKEDMHDSESRMNSKQNQQISVGIMRDIINSIQVMLINMFFMQKDIFSSQFSFQYRGFIFLEKVNLVVLHKNRLENDTSSNSLPNSYH